MMMVMSVMAVALHLIEILGEDPALCQIFCLRRRRGRAENGAVRAQMRIAVLVVGVLSVCLTATAQYQDRDTRGVPKTSATAPPPEARTDINHASLDELLKVPGMTRSWAGRIIRFRPYRTKQDLLEHGVVTSQVYDRIKDYVIAHRDAQR
jgi:DNA uptake protein ComE-like DNA-binding protein